MHVVFVAMRKNLEVAELVAVVDELEDARPEVQLGVRGVAIDFVDNHMLITHLGIIYICICIRNRRVHH